VVPVECLVIDVRARPWGAWHRAFTAAGLAEAFKRHAGYWSLVPLGNVSGSAEVWTSPAPGAAEWMLEGVAEVIRGGQAVCLLCAEADARRCHRSVLARLLQERVAGLEVVDL